MTPDRRKNAHRRPHKNHRFDTTVTTADQRFRLIFLPFLEFERKFWLQIRLECPAFWSPPALMANENGFSGSAFVAGAGDVDSLLDGFVRIHRYVWARIVCLYDLHASDESRLGVG